MAGRVAHGDLGNVIKVDAANDETGQLMQSLDAMQRDLRQRIDADAAVAAGEPAYPSGTGQCRRTGHRIRRRQHTDLHETAARRCSPRWRRLEAFPAFWRTGWLVSVCPTTWTIRTCSSLTGRSCRAKTIEVRRGPNHASGGQSRLRHRWQIPGAGHAVDRSHRGTGRTGTRPGAAAGGTRCGGRESTHPHRAGQCVIECDDGGYRAQHRLPEPRRPCIVQRGGR